MKRHFHALSSSPLGRVVLLAVTCSFAWCLFNAAAAAQKIASSPFDDALNFSTPRLRVACSSALLLPPLAPTAPLNEQYARGAASSLPLVGAAKRARRDSSPSRVLRPASVVHAAARTLRWRRQPPRNGLRAASSAPG